jgi:beta-N-acetylhexosaminidase
LITLPFMKWFLPFFILFPFTAFSQEAVKSNYLLADFYLPNPALDVRVNLIFESLSEEQRVGQMIMPSAGKLGKSTDHVMRLVAEGKVGGVLLLNGTREEFKRFTIAFNSISQGMGHLPLLFSADAELSLINMKIKETKPVKYANKITSVQEVETETMKIVEELLYMGVNYNFAPVVDLSPNATVSFRSFGLSQDTIIKYSNRFISVSQANQVATTAKHFPGHGYVFGDTHKQLVYIDGEMKEVGVYVPLIANNVISIMVAHIAVKNNKKYDTAGLPATVSRNIVTDLLRKEMGFNGIIITDAMGMGGVSSVPKNGLKAAAAGCDIILMPKDEDEVFNDILAETKINAEFKEQVYASVKRILRLKICLGII